MPPAKPSQSGRRRGAKPKGRPVQGNPPDDRIPRGPDFYRPKRVCADLFPACSCAFSNHPAGPQDAFFKAYGIYQPDVGFFENPTWPGELPPASRSRPGPRTRREDHAPLIVPMSSGRLFLDQVGRHQWHTRRGRLDKEERNSMRVGSRYPDKCPASAVKTAGSMVPSKARPPVWFRASCSTQ